MSRLEKFDIKKVNNYMLEQINETLIESYGFSLSFKSIEGDNFCKCICEEIEDSTFSDAFGEKGTIEFNYSHDEGLKVVVNVSKDKSSKLYSKMPDLIEQNILDKEKFDYSYTEIDEQTQTMSFTIKYFYNFEENTKQSIDILAMMLINIVL